MLLKENMFYMFDILAVALNVFITFGFNPLSANPIKWLNTLNSSAVTDKLFDCVYIIYIIYIYILYIYQLWVPLYKCQIYINNSRGHIYIYHIYIYYTYILYIYYIYRYIRYFLKQRNGRFSIYWNWKRMVIAMRVSQTPKFFTTFLEIICRNNKASLVNMLV